MDPRSRRQPQSATTDLDLAKPLVLQNDGRVGLELTGALAVDSQGKLVVRVSNGLQVAPGSPVSLQLAIADDSIEITKEGRVQARPRTSHVIMDNAGSPMTGRTLREVLELEVEAKKYKGAADGYCELDSSAKVPAARVPFELMPLDIYVSGIKEPTYDAYVHRFEGDIAGAGVNWATTTNSVSGSPIKFSAQGADTDIGIEITTKGLGALTVNGDLVEFDANKNIAGGYAGLDGSAKVAPAQLPLFTSIADGAVSASGGGTTNFLRADGSWAAPGGGGGGGLSQANALAIASFGSF